MIEEIKLNSLKMNHFTVLDAQLYCQISGINPEYIVNLNLNNNYLTDISGVSIFKNIENLILSSNEITDLSPLKNLSKLESLYISFLNLTDELKTVNILKNLPNLNHLECYNTFKKIDIKNKLKGIKIYD